MIELIERLRSPWRKPENKPPETEEAADLIESQAAEIKRLKGMVGEIQSARYIHREHDKLLVAIAVWKSLCDQMAAALLHMCHTCTADDDYNSELVRKALDAWRSAK